MRLRSRTTAVGMIAALLVLAASQAATADAPTRADVYRFADRSQIPGAWSSLITSAQGAKMTLQTSELPAGDTVTVLWVIFNEPENCTHGEGDLRCGAGDLLIYGGDDSAVTSVVYAAGHRIGGSGDAAFSGRLASGDTSGALFGPGLVSPTSADIHLVVYDHGALSAQGIAEGIHGFGPCEPECVDLQYSPHEQ